MEKIRKNYFYYDEIKKEFFKLFEDKKSMRINHHNLKVTFIREILHGLDIIKDFYEVLFFLFPLLSKSEENENKEKLFILKKIFPDEKFKYSKLFKLYYRLFEIYTFLILEYLVLILIVSYFVRKLEKKLER